MVVSLEYINKREEIQNKSMMTIEEILQRIVLVSKYDILSEYYLLKLANQFGTNVLVLDAPIKRAISWKRD